MFGHPNFLWPCRGLNPAGGRWLREPVARPAGHHEHRAPHVRVRHIGTGYSTPAVVGDRIYLLGNEGPENEFVQALNVSDGSQIWSTRLGNVILMEDFVQLNADRVQAIMRALAARSRVVAVSSVVFTPASSVAFATTSRPTADTSTVLASSSRPSGSPGP